MLEIVSAIFFLFYIISPGKYCNSGKLNALVATKIDTEALLSFLWTVGFEIVTNKEQRSEQVAKNLLPSTHSTSIPQWTFPILALNFGVTAGTVVVPCAALG